MQETIQAKIKAPPTTYLTDVDGPAGGAGGDDEGDDPEEEQEASEYEGEPEHRGGAAALSLLHQEHLLTLRARSRVKLSMEGDLNLS